MDEYEVFAVRRLRYDKELDDVVEDPNGGIEVTINRPIISREERIRRINQFAKTLSDLFHCEITLTLKEGK
jgi:hypothetical protein